MKNIGQKATEDNFTAVYLFILNLMLSKLFCFSLQYGTGLEKSKVFVKNLPFTITKEALITMFEEVWNINFPFGTKCVLFPSWQEKGEFL